MTVGEARIVVEREKGYSGSSDEKKLGDQGTRQRKDEGTKGASDQVTK